MEKLNEESITAWLENHGDWSRVEDQIRRTYSFESFREAIVFVNRVATIADELNHHPDIDIRYSKITLTITTHDAGGLTEKDFELAQKVDFATSR